MLSKGTRAQRDRNGEKTVQDGFRTATGNQAAPQAAGKTAQGDNSRGADAQKEEALARRVSTMSPVSLVNWRLSAPIGFPAPIDKSRQSWVGLKKHGAIWQDFSDDSFPPHAGRAFLVRSTAPIVRSAAARVANRHARLHIGHRLIYDLAE